MLSFGDLGKQLVWLGPLNIKNQEEAIFSLVKELKVTATQFGQKYIFIEMIELIVTNFYIVLCIFSFPSCFFKFNGP